MSSPTGPSRLRGWRLAAVLVSLYAFVTLVMMWPFMNLRALGSASYEGDARLILWTLAWDNHAVLDRVPIFDANIYYPAVSALGYNDPLIGISLFTLPIYAATRNPVLAYNLVWLVTPLLNLLAMHALAWRYLRSHRAAAAAALTFACSFYTMQHAYGHLSLIWLWLVPLSLLLLERWFERQTMARALVWAAALTLQVLSAWYIGTFALVANGLLFVWRGVADIRAQWPRRAWQLAIASAIGIAVVWPVASRYRGLAAPTLAEIHSYAADWSSYLVPPANTLAGEWWSSHIGTGPREIWGEQTLFAGWIAIALGVLGLAAIARDRAWRTSGVYLALLVAAVWLSFGPVVTRAGQGLSLFGLFMHLPGASGIRAPARFAMLAVLALAILVGYAVRAADARWPRSRWALLVVLPLMLAEWRVVDLPAGHPQPAPIPAIYRSAALRAARAIVSLPDYCGRPDWFLGADYLYYSTAHWRPIVNGFGRAEPKDYAHFVSRMNAFPGPNNAKAMRDAGVDYVILHAARYPDHAAAILRDAAALPDYELVLRDGDDYLFSVR